MTSPIDSYVSAQLNVADSASNAGVAKQVAEIKQNADSVTVRQGRVISYSASSITVAISGSPVLVNASYLSSYTPVPGDLVTVLKVGASWVVLGTFMDMPDNNLLQNGSFELATNAFGTTGNLTPWEFVVLQNAAGTPTVTAVRVDATIIPNGQLVAGNYAARIEILTNGTGTNSEALLRSEAIPVVPGETYVAVGSRSLDIEILNLKVVGGGTAAFLPQTQSFIGVYFYTGQTQAEPAPNQNFVSAFQDAPHGTETGWSLIQTPPAVVPTGMSWARVALDFWVSDTDNNTYRCMWDRVILRKIINADGSPVT